VAFRTDDELIERAMEGHVPSISRLISRLERGGHDGDGLLAKLHAESGKAHIIGITGAAGSGKSTLVNADAHELRKRGRTVGIIAVDPSSSITGGAILGDRIRMQDHTLDPGIYVRSMSTRGSMGGLSRATIDAVTVLDASGRDVVIIETVGVGQDEVDVVQAAHTVAVVSVPGMGDDIQAIKAGLLEVADIHVVNKADRPDANRTIAELRTMLSLIGPPPPGGWDIPILPTVAADGTGVADLVDTFERHLAWLRESGELEAREHRSAEARVTAVAQDLLLEELVSPSRGDAFERAVEDVQHRRIDPRTAGRRLIRVAAGASEPEGAAR
jgi:LAO/AO transport system kinase